MEPLPPALAQPPRLRGRASRPGAAWVLAVGLGLAGAAFGYGLGKLLKHHTAWRPPRWDIGAGEGMLLGLAAVMAIWLVLAVHELGHLLGGRLAGWKPALFCVGPLRLDFGGPRVRVSFNRAWGTWGGLAAAVPPDGQATPAGLWRVVAGGPLASVALAAAAGALAYLNNGGAAVAWGAVALMSAAIAVATLVPTQLGGLRSDGAQLWALWRRDPAVAERLALSSVWTQSMAGVRPREWEAGAIHAALAAEHDPQVRLLGALMKAQAALDRRDGPASQRDFLAYAELLHQGGLQGVAAPLRPALLLPLVVYLAQFEGQASAARAWFEAAKGGMSEPHALAHARAALAWAEGRPVEALAEAERALAAGPQSQDPGAWAAARDDLLALQERLRATAPSPASAA